MQPDPVTRHPFASIVQRSVIAASTVAIAALVAVGCGDDSGGGGSAGADADALAWLPADTWLVATGDLSAERIDEAVTTLDRLPIWALAEGFLPASDGAGLRNELLEQVATGARAGDGPGDGTTAEQLEAAFGDRVGFAIFEADFAAIDAEEDMPFLAWVEVDDEDRAAAIATDVFDGEDREEEHEGRTFFVNGEDEAVWAVQDGLLLVTTTAGRMRELVDVREGEGDGSLADDELGAAVRAATGDSFASVALQTDPLMDAAPGLARMAAEDLPEGDADAERALDVAERLAAALEADSVRELVPDWVAGSMTIDDVGLRFRGAWSNPRDLADADPSARELVERMPAGVATASGMATRGEDLGRLQDAWADARDEADLDLREAVDCPEQQAWACELGVEALLAVLEDEELADAAAEQGDMAAVLVQDLGPALEAAVAAGNRTDPAAAPRFEGRILELVAPAAEPIDWQPGDDLAGAMERAGIAVEREDDAVVIRIAPASPMGRALLRNLDPESAAALRAFGIDVRAALTPLGLRIAPEEVDGLHVFGLPLDAESAVAAGLRSGDDTLGDSDDYRAVVEAAGAPDEVGSWAWVDLAGIVEGALTSVAAQSPEVRRAVPTVRNNLADVPGAIAWSTVEEVDGERVGISEAVLPILD